MLSAKKNGLYQAETCMGSVSFFNFPLLCSITGSLTLQAETPKLLHKLASSRHLQDCEGERKGEVTIFLLPLYLLAPLMFPAFPWFDLWGLVVAQPLLLFSSSFTSITNSLNNIPSVLNARSDFNILFRFLQV